METSALLCWLFHEARREEVASWIEGADLVVASDLTFLEARRAVARVEAKGSKAADVAAMRAELERLAKAWWVLPIAETVVRWSADPFPIEPVRSLDAIHLATAWLVTYENADQVLVLLTLDRRVRVNGWADGFAVEPPLPDEARDLVERAP